MGTSAVCKRNGVLKMSFSYLLCFCFFIVLLPNDIIASDFYEFEVNDINGETVSLEKYRGKISLVVNVASLCGYTDTTYRALKRLQDILGYGGKFNVLAFPCNQFGEQEPYEDEAISNFASTNYAVEFPMFSKIDVIGENAHPAFQNLISQSSVHPDWNFYKYLVDQNGAVLRAWSSKSTIEEIFDNIEQAIDANSADIASEPVNTDPEAAEAVKDEL